MDFNDDIVTLRGLFAPLEPRRARRNIVGWFEFYYRAMRRIGFIAYGKHTRKAVAIILFDLFYYWLKHAAARLRPARLPWD